MFDLQKSSNEWQTRIKLLLALHREITMNNVYGGDQKKLTDKVCTRIICIFDQLNHSLYMNIIFHLFIILLSVHIDVSYFLYL